MMTRIAVVVVALALFVGLIAAFGDGGAIRLTSVASADEFNDPKTKLTTTPDKDNNNVNKNLFKNNNNKVTGRFVQTYSRKPPIAPVFKKSGTNPSRGQQFSGLPTFYRILNNFGEAMYIQEPYNGVTLTSNGNTSIDYMAFTDWYTLAPEGSVGNNLENDIFFEISPVSDPGIINFFDVALAAGGVYTIILDGMCETLLLLI
jgi:hypothetical protein